MHLFNQTVNFFRQLYHTLIRFGLAALLLMGCTTTPAPTTPTVSDMSLPTVAAAAAAPVATRRPIATDPPTPSITQITEINRRRLERGLVGRMAFTPQGGLLAVTFRDLLNKPDKGIGLYTVDPFMETDFIETFKADQNINHLALSPDGTTLAVALPHQIQLWPLENGKFTANTPAHKLNDTVGAEILAFSPDGALLASAHWPGIIRLWYTADGTLVRTIGTLTGSTAWVKSLQFSPDGAVLAAGDVNGAISLYNVANGTLLATFGGTEQLTTHTWGVTRLAFSPDGALLAATDPENWNTHIWRVSDGALLHTFQEDTNNVNGYIFSSDGRTLITLRANVHLWDVAEETLVYRQEIPGTFLAGGGLVSPDTLLTVSAKGLVQLWALPFQSLQQLPGSTLRLTTTAVPTPTSLPAPLPSPTPDPIRQRAIERLTAETESVESTIREQVGLFPLNAPGNPPLWLVFSYNHIPEEESFVAVYRQNGAAWQEVDRLSLAYTGLDTLFADGVKPTQIAPHRLWLELSGDGWELNHLCDIYLSFGAEMLRIDYAHCAPGRGSWLDDLNGDGLPEIVQDVSDPYIFCHACNVRYVNFQVWRWNGHKIEQVELTALPKSAPDALRQLNQQALALARAGLWERAGSAITQALSIAPENVILIWNDIVIRTQTNAKREDIGYSNYPLLSQVFYGDYPAVLEAMRVHAIADIFDPNGPLVADTIASRQYHQKDMLRAMTFAASTTLEHQPDYAPAYFLRGWAAYLNNPESGEALTDIEQAATLNPDEALYRDSANYLAGLSPPTN